MRVPGADQGLQRLWVVRIDDARVRCRPSPYNGNGFRFVLRADGSALEIYHGDRVPDCGYAGTVDVARVHALGDVLEAQGFFEMPATFGIPNRLGELLPDVETTAVRDGIRKTVTNDDPVPSPALAAVQAAIQDVRRGISWRLVTPPTDAFFRCKAFLPPGTTG